MPYSEHHKEEPVADIDRKQAHGGGGEIRTHVPVRTTRFRVVGSEDSRGTSGCFWVLGGAGKMASRCGFEGDGAGRERLRGK